MNNRNMGQFQPIMVKVQKHFLDIGFLKLYKCVYSIKKRISYCVLRKNIIFRETFYCLGNS